MHHQLRRRPLHHIGHIDVGISQEPVAVTHHQVDAGEVAAMTQVQQRLQQAGVSKDSIRTLSY